MRLLIRVGASASSANEGKRDTVEGLQRLRKGFLISPHSNGNLSLMTWLSKNVGLPWDCTLSAEISMHYKPDKEVYLTAADLLDLKPSQIIRVAAHKFDLQADKALGFKTAFIQRPLECGRNTPADTFPDPDFDYSVKVQKDLAIKLGV